MWATDRIGIICMNPTQPKNICTLFLWHVWAMELGNMLPVRGGFQNVIDLAGRDILKKEEKSLFAQWKIYVVCIYIYEHKKLICRIKGE